MDIEDLNSDERALIEIIRAFKFLRQESYHEKEISIGGRSNPSIIYYSSKVNRIVKILGDESQSWTIVIQRRKLFDLNKADSFFDISNYYSTFGGSMVKGKNYTLKSQVDFIQQHLMPVIKGEVWIDELIKQKNK
ncbi:MAG TPA: hypothetical protein VIO15_06155 [Bacteroidales bacterium]